MAVADLRGILHYVPQFRGKTFVVAVDGDVLASPQQAQLMLDLALLHALSIRLVLVFGARVQVEKAAEKAAIVPSNTDGTGATDDATLEVCLAAISRLSSELMRGLTTVGLRTANPNAVHARAAGIVEGIDQGHTGRIESIDAQGLRALLDDGMVPLIAPLSYDRSGNALRLNSDAVALAVARELEADKILYLSEEPPPTGDGGVGAQFSEQDAIAQSERISAGGGSPGMASKFRHASRACHRGVARVHIIDGHDSEALLSELFSNEGVGAMVYADDYLLIRSAEPGDIPEILTLIEGAVEEGLLLARNHEDIEGRLDDFSILEVDGNPIACIALHRHEDARKLGEIACLFVRSTHTRLGHGSRLLRHAEERARAEGIEALFTLTTGAPGFFEDKAEFRVGEASDLPPARQEKLETSGRGSRVLFKSLG